MASKMLVLEDVVKTRAEHPRAEFCDLCEGIEFRIHRGDPTTTECLRCGRVQAYPRDVLPPAPESERVRKARRAIEAAIGDLEDAAAELER